MQTILGAGGPVANALTRLIEQDHHSLRLASRRAINTSGNTTWQKTDLLNRSEVLSATAGSDVIYLTAGLVYDSRIWARQWPVIIENVMEAAKTHNARLLFFDNIYMYGLVNGPIKEDTAYNPISRKGEVRAKVARRFMDEVKAGNLNGTIARAADFYGAESGNSFIDMLLLKPFSMGKMAQWMGNPNCLHNYTYVPDAAKGMYLLGKNEQSDGRVWHLPTAKPIKGTDLLQLAANAYEVKPRYIRLPKIVFRTMGLMQRFMKELVELYYQTDHDYLFNSDKFEQAFGVQPTPYSEGISWVRDTLLPKK